MNMTIRKRLTILSVTAVLIPITLLSILFFIFGSKMLIKETTDRTLEKMIILDQGITLYIEKIKHLVSTIANLPMVIGLDTNKIKTYKFSSEWSDMMPLHNTPDEVELYKYLKLVNQANTDLGAVYIGTESGKFVMYPPTSRRPYYDPSQRSWFTEARLQNGRPTITNPFKSSDTNFTIFAIAQSVYFIRNQEYGVVSANITLNSITRILSQFSIGKDNFIILANKDNTIIANTLDIRTNMKAFDDENMDSVYKYLSQLKINSWEEIKMNNKIYLAHKIHSTGTGWYLYSLINRDEIVEPFWKVFYLLIMISVILLSIFIPCAIKFSMDSLVPLKNLSSHLFAITNGNESLHKKISISGVNDEIGKTIENFNIFSESLNNTFAVINKSQQAISENISKLSNLVLLSSANMVKKSSSFENIKIEIYHAETCVENLSKLAEEISTLVDTEKNSKNFYKYSGIIKIETEQLENYLKYIMSYFQDMKKTSEDIDSCIEETTVYCKSSRQELSAICKILSIYKIKPHGGEKS